MSQRAAAGSVTVSQENLGNFAAPRNLSRHPGRNRGEASDSQVLLGIITIGGLA